MADFDPRVFYNGVEGHWRQCCYCYAYVESTPNQPMPSVHLEPCPVSVAEKAVAEVQRLCALDRPRQEQRCEWCGWDPRAAADRPRQAEAGLDTRALRELTAWYPHWNGAPMGWYKVSDVLGWLAALDRERVAPPAGETPLDLPDGGGYKDSLHGKSCDKCLGEFK